MQIEATKLQQETERYCKSRKGCTDCALVHICADCTGNACKGYFSALNAIAETIAPWLAANPDNQFTAEEIGQLKFLRDMANMHWLTRDKSGATYLYHNKPKKGCVDSWNILPNDFLYVRAVFKTPMKGVSWNDPEPFNLDSLD